MPASCGDAHTPKYLVPGTVCLENGHGFVAGMVLKLLTYFHSWSVSLSRTLSLKLLPYLEKSAKS